ncbi:MAG TPA: pyridoxamine 5'-phosphate oxidase family protein [Candidatus Bathyarchaeia archaeon]|nr:pyridoxamine 5'-phosphate oxidase family protein [Candidatus Bathyarchaeia archaeon]
MEKRQLPPEMVEVLTTSHFAYLCTTNRGNQPHITPMFFVFDGKTNDIYVTASSESKKMKNIHDNPKISLTVDIRDATNPFNNRGVMVQGKAVVHYAIDSLSLLDDENLLQVYATFKNKYPVLKKVQSPVLDEYKKFSETLMNISPKRMVYWRGTNFISVNFDGHK